MFEGISPDNYEQKCLCVLVLDVSGSMGGEPIRQLNEGLEEFQRELERDFVASQRLEIAIVTFGSKAECIQEPALIGNFLMPGLSVYGSTKMVDGVREAIKIIENRKAWYRSTGQTYFRPMMVLITDGEPDADQDINGLGYQLKADILAKKFMFYSVGVKGYNHQKLLQVCSTPPPMALDGLKFSEFFKWLSSSIDIITKSSEGDKILLPPVNDWAQIQL